MLLDASPQINQRELYNMINGTIAEFSDDLMMMAGDLNQTLTPEDVQSLMEPVTDILMNLNETAPTDEIQVLTEKFIMDLMTVSAEVDSMMMLEEARELLSEYADNLERTAGYLNETIAQVELEA